MRRHRGKNGCRPAPLTCLLRVNTWKRDPIPAPTKWKQRIRRKRANFPAQGKANLPCMSTPTPLIKPSEKHRKSWKRWWGCDRKYCLYRVSQCPYHEKKPGSCSQLEGNCLVFILQWSPAGPAHSRCTSAQAYCGNGLSWTLRPPVSPAWCRAVALIPPWTFLFLLSERSRCMYAWF